MAQWGLADDLESLGAEAAKRICTPSCFLWDCIRAQWDTGPGVLGTGQEEALPVLGSPVLQAEASENWHKSRTAHNDLAYGSDPHLPAEGRTALRGGKNSEGKPLNFVCYGMHGRGHYCRARAGVQRKMLCIRHTCLC